MAQVRLRSVWMNAVDDPRDWLYLDSTSELTRADSVEGYFQRTATRMRWVQTQRGARLWVVRCDLSTADERAWLRAHIGEPGVWVRDHLGQRVCGVFTQVQDSPIVSDDLSPLSITITEISAP